MEKRHRAFYGTEGCRFESCAARFISLCLPKTPSSLMTKDLRDSPFEGVSTTIHPH